eukprot:scaffold8195_cov156-Amphora_coffeaeformis.AAC.3
MPSPQDITFKFIFPALGIVIGNAMFSAPVKDLKAAVNRGFLGDLNPTPFAFMLGNCCGWVAYSILVNDLWIFAGNAPGFCLSIWLNMGATKLQYQAFRMTEIRKSLKSHFEKLRTEEVAENTKHDSTYSSDSAQSQDKNGSHVSAIDPADKIIHSLTSFESSEIVAPHESVVMIISMIWVACIALVAFGSGFSQTTKEWIVGIFVNLNLVFFYGAPLSTIWTVLRTRNSASIHILTMIGNTLNGTFWGLYGLAILDPFMATPNLLGTALGVIQIFLVVTFSRIPYKGSLPQ